MQQLESMRSANNMMGGGPQGGGARMGMGDSGMMGGGGGRQNIGLLDHPYKQRPPKRAGTFLDGNG